MTSIKEQITEDVEDTLRGIQTLAGYDSNAIVERAKQWGNDPADRKIVLYLGSCEEIPDNEGALGLKTWTQRYHALCYCVESETSSVPIDTRINSLEADVHRRLMVDPHRSGLAIDTTLRGSNRIIDDGGVVAGVEVIFDVQFRHDWNDPRSLT